MQTCIKECDPDGKCKTLSLQQTGMASNGTGSQSVIKTGYFLKQGGNRRNWKRRYFVLTESSLTYYKDEGGAKQKGKVKLVVGRGVRKQDNCKAEWPKDANKDFCFGIATESRTYYLTTTELDAASVQEWMEAIQKVIEKVGKPSNDWENDIEGKPEGLVSKAVRGTVKVTAKLTKSVASDSGLLDDKWGDVASRAADFAEAQADADPHASAKERGKLAAIGGAGFAGAALDATSQFVPNEIGVGAMVTVGAVLKDQADTDPDLSVKQRLVLAGGSALEGASEFVPDEVGAGVLQVAGGIVKDQAETDEDTNWQQRLALGVGSAANGVGDLDVLEGNAIAAAVTGAVGKAADSVVEELGNEE